MGLMVTHSKIRISFPQIHLCDQSWFYFTSIFLKAWCQLMGQMVTKSNIIIHIFHIDSFFQSWFYLRSVFVKVWFQSRSIFLGGGGLGGEKLGKESNIEIYIFGGLGLGGWLWPSILRDCPNTFKQVGMKSGCCCHLFVLAVAICRSQVCKKPPAFQSKLAKLLSCSDLRFHNSPSSS